MTLKLYTFQYRHTGKTYRATGHTAVEAAKKIPIPYKDLVLQLLETIPVQERFSDHGFQAYKPLADRRGTPN